MKENKPVPIEKLAAITVEWFKRQFRQGKLLKTSGVLIGIAAGVFSIWANFDRIWIDESKNKLTTNIESGPFELPSSVIDPKLQKMQWLSRIEVKNDLEQLAEEVAIDWKGKGFVSITDFSGNIIEDDFVDRIELGKLPINKAATVCIWTPTQYVPGNACVTHAGGETAIPYKRIDYGLYASIGQLYGMILVLGFFAAVFRYLFTGSLDSEPDTSPVTS